MKTFGKWSPTATWNNILVADFDGDGFKDDIVGRIQATSDLWVSISDGETFTNKKFGFWPKAFIWVDALVGDFDQDGEIDDLAGRASNGTWIVSFSDGKKFKNKIFGHWETGGYENLLNGDFDGDGFQDDILGYDKNEKTWIVSFSDGKILKNKHLNLKMKNKFANVHTRDFNGDIVEDICFRDLVTGNWIAFDLKEEKQKVIGNWDVKQDWDTVVTGDFNGDEKLDVLGKLHIGKFGWLQVSEFNGKKLENKFYAGPSVNLSENPMLNKHWKWPPHLNVEEVQVADFNGDGLSDFAGKVPGSDSWMFLEIEDKQKSMRRLSSK